MNILVTAPPDLSPDLLCGCYSVIIYNKHSQIHITPAMVNGLSLEFPFNQEHKVIDTMLVCSKTGHILVEIKPSSDPHE